MNPEHNTANAATTLVGAGDVSPDHLRAALSVAPALVAADGGAHHLAATGHRPQAIIGDLDSLGAREIWDAQGVAIHHVPEQESTDFDKCLRMVQAPLFVAVGFAGDRLDHMLAALSVLAARPDKAAILMGGCDLCFLAPLSTTLQLDPLQRVSLWPIAPTRVLHSEGLEWPADDLLLDPTGRTGTSNRAIGGRVSLSFDRRGVFVILPDTALPAAVACLSMPAD